ncbi:unnamed protein product, partial [Brenthis ino]
MSESVGCGSTTEDETETVHVGVSSSTINDVQFASNIDMRYGGQYLTPEQLPEFCNQLHHLVEVIRNIQSYAKVTGEYPRELERRLDREAREVAALVAEARHAREAASRARLQRRALRAERARVLLDLAKLRDTEIRELESSVRALDRKLYKSWEALRDRNDLAAFEPLLEEVRNKQAALECLIRLIENRKACIGRAPAPAPHALPMSTKEGGIHKRQDSRRASKRRRKEAAREPRSVPLSLEASHHNPQQVTLYIQGSGAAVGPLELPSRPSVRDILFFSID